MNIKLTKMLVIVSLVLVLIISISDISTQNVDAIKNDVNANNLVNIGTTDSSSLCDNSFCYKNVAYQEVGQLPTIQNNSSQMTNNSDASKEVISAINQAQEYKRSYEQNHTGVQNGPWKVMSGSLHSVPEIHTELSATNPPNHQIAIVLPDTGKIYEGVMAYSATTDVTPNTFVVPVNSTVKGQLVAAMDGKHLYAITNIDDNQSIGTWQSAGRVFHIHNTRPIPFDVNYTVIYRELEPSENNKVGTIQSSPITILGNDSEQIAMILPPTTEKNQSSGILSYTASENVQLVVFQGPLGDQEGKGQKIWSPDNGKTRYALITIDPANKMGNLLFNGNGLAMRSSDNKPFTLSYAVVSGG